MVIPLGERKPKPEFGDARRQQENALRRPAAQQARQPVGVA